jgi:very-short-patch-repair endonuclease
MPCRHIESSFSSHDIDPDRVTKAGARLLADYLEYAGSGGTALGASGLDELISFEADVRDRLAEFGITVVPQYGVGGYRIDFAAAHPEDPGRMVLAIEADGASYRQSGSVRDRDRLRGEHLQRLGWSFHRLWSTNWFYESKAEVAKLREVYQRAVAAADQGRTAGAAGPGGAGRRVGQGAVPGGTAVAAGGRARAGTGRQCAAGAAGAAKLTVIRVNPSELSIPCSMARVLRSASASSGLRRAAVWIRCCAAT